MTDELDDRRHDGFAAREKLGWTMAAALLVLTLGEYVVSVQLDEPLWWLMPFIIAKGVVILEYFMHFTSLFDPEEH